MPRDREHHREIGELLLAVDEMEDTLRVMEERPDLRASGGGEAHASTIHRLEERIRRERERLAALEQRGRIDYDEIERAIRLADAMG